jgi:outer membrane beta-barrel protein
MSVDRRTVKRAALLLALCAALAPRAASAGKADAFEGKIRPISGQLYSKAGRFELTPTANLSLNDAFFSKQLFGGRLGYHFTEQWSIGGFFVGGRTSATGSASVCPTNVGCGEASTVQLNQVPGAITRMAGGELAFSPVYGKLNVLAERVLHFDFSLLLGVDWITHRQAVSSVEAANLASAEAPTRSTVGLHAGLGARVFLTQFLAFRVEVKDYVYRVPIGNFGGESDTQNQLFTELGLSVFFPFHPSAQR